MRLIARRHGKPWSGVAESSIRVVAPLHRGAFAVAAFFFGPAGAANRIFNIFPPLRVVIFHADFFSVIHLRRGTSCEQKRGHKLRNLLVVDAVSVAVPSARLIMIVDCVSGSELVAGLKANDRVDRKHGLAILESVVPGSRAESVLVAEFGTDG